jgi:D-glycero-alpha-D-manno-heptose-7-phosphate kinase
MITIRTPFRISLGGGGTDLPAYYEQYEGHLITAAINKYMYVNINESATSDKLKLYYSTVEILCSTCTDDIKHDIIRESLKYFNIQCPLEIASMADIEAGTGMGSSSSFTVALLSGLNTLNRKYIPLKELAEEACRIEIDLVGKKIGKQDQYIAAFGGIQEMYIFKNGRVDIKPLDLKKDFISELEGRLLIFYTGIRRPAGIVLDDQSDSIKSNHGGVIEHMNLIKEMGYRIGDALKKEDIDELGFIFHEHWQEKRKISKRMSDADIDEWYELALISGAIGGKLIGAGGGGFLLFVCQENRRKELIRVMENAGLRFMDFRFDFDGVKILTNI